MDNALSLYTTAQDDFADMRQQDVIMPRLSLMQATSEAVATGKFKCGQVIDSTTQNVVIDCNDAKLCKQKIVPLVFWLEWLEWNPDRSAPKDKKVLSRSTDPQSELAKMASRYEEITTPNGKRLRVTEIYNFIVAMPSLTGNLTEAFVLAFQKSSHKTGKLFLNKLVNSKVRVEDQLIKAPIWLSSWELSTSIERKDGNVYAKYNIGGSEQNRTEDHQQLKDLRDGFNEMKAALMAKNSAAEDSHEEDVVAASGSDASKKAEPPF